MARSESKFGKLKRGEVVSEEQYYTVVEKLPHKVILKNDSGNHIEVDEKYVNECLTSASDYVKEEKVSRTALIEKFMGAARMAVTVNFNKKPKEEDVKKELYALMDRKFRSQAEKKRAVDEVVDLRGEERTMIGRHHGGVDDFGRVHFVDMEVSRDPSKTYDTRQRLVDPRTINWCIIDGVKFIVK